MNAVIDFLRRQLFLILCGAGGLAGIALIVTGLGRMPAVAEQMKVSEKLYQDLGNVQGKPANRSHLSIQEDRISKIKEARDAVVARAAGLHNYKPLLDNVFPSGDTDQRFAFRQAYGAAMRELLKSLNAGEPPTALEIERAAERIKEEAYQYELSVKNNPSAVVTEVGPKTTPAGLLTADGARIEAEARASLGKARNILIYAQEVADTKSADRASSLQFEAAMRDKGSIEAPSIDDCWYAQVAYWIQKDVVDAIAALNGEAQRAATDRGENPWVGIMPVKDIISIRVHQGYIDEKGNAQASLSMPGGGSEARPFGGPEVSFTKLSSSGDYEVVQFTVKLVMDQRDINRFVERLCGNRFHNVIRVSYKAVPPNLTMKKKIYGPEPVVSAVMDFETVFLGIGVGSDSASNFRKWMPTTICEKYGIDCPAEESPADGGDGG